MRIVQITDSPGELFEAEMVAAALRRRHEIVLASASARHGREGEDPFAGITAPLPDHRLEAGSGSATDRTARLLVQLERLLVQLEPTLIVLHGDGSVTLAGALAAAKLLIPIARIGAGVRSLDRAMPAEATRLVADRLATLHFAPTAKAVSNLLREGIVGSVYEVGDLTFDLFLRQRMLAMSGACCVGLNIGARLGLRPGEFYLAALGRAAIREESNLRGIVEGILSLERSVVFPVVPEVHGALAESGLLSRLEEARHVMLLDPVPYVDFVALEHGARLVLADSGRVQKESYLACTPCLTLARSSEWAETVEDGWNLVVGMDRERMVEAASGCEPEGERSLHFGDGRAAQKIADHLERWGAAGRVAGDGE